MHNQHDSIQFKFSKCTQKSASTKKLIAGCGYLVVYDGKMLHWKSEINWKTHFFLMTIITIQRVRFSVSHVISSFT